MKMCSIIREYEYKINNLESTGTDVSLTLEAKIRVLKSENKSLEKENEKLFKRAEESNNDCEKLTLEYKQLVAQISDNKVTDQKQRRKSKEERALTQQYEAEIRRVSSILEQADQTKKELIEKYASELAVVKDTYEKTISLQKDNMKNYRQKVEEELDFMHSKLQNRREKLNNRNNSKNDRYPKERDRLSDILRDFASKEATVKSLRGEAKTLKTQISKLKIKNKDFKSKIIELKEIIDVNPRAKRMLEKQKGELNTNYQRVSAENHKFNESKCINNSNVTLREYNDLMEENITIKLEATRLSTAIAHLEETNIKLENEIDQFESENQRLQKRCDNLIDTEVQNEARVIDNNESRLNQRICELTEEIEDMQSNNVPFSEFEALQNQLQDTEEKLSQSQIKLKSKKLNVQNKKSKQPEDQYLNINLNQSQNEEQLNQLLEDKNQIIQTLEQEVKKWKLDNIRLSSELETIENKAGQNNEQSQRVFQELQHLKESVAILESENERLKQANDSLCELEKANHIKDKVIQQLKSNLDKTIDKFNDSPHSKDINQESIEEQPDGEYTLGVPQSGLSLDKIIGKVQQFFNSADVEEINEFLNFIKSLCDQVENESMMMLSSEPTEYQAQQSDDVPHEANIREPYFSNQSCSFEGESSENEYLTNEQRSDLQKQYYEKLVKNYEHQQ